MITHSFGIVNLSCIIWLPPGHDVSRCLFFPDGKKQQTIIFAVVAGFLVGRLGSVYLLLR
ncbi:Uncharacterised protein [Salmonella enterica subsp. enterica]|uniref:Uncharacterized protein n=1 Tax=Salmonella enterica I TaxID=59201 RepID=A0A3S4JGA3_SALET|nr:Uncharacterised protein [Salmonella enterica subsp. enterica]